MPELLDQAFAKRDGLLWLGPAGFDAQDGRLVYLGDLAIDGPVLDVWRAPTDNDIGHWRGHRVARHWRAAGLHRMRHRVVAVDPAAPGLVVRTRVAPAAQPFGLLAEYRWEAQVDGGVRLTVEVLPDGRWPDIPLPRLGLLLAVPGHLEMAEWYGAGPGEAYPDMRRAARVGRYTCVVDRLQTPYLRPQENGHRIDTRWARLVDPRTGAGISVEGAPLFGFTARRWTTSGLDAATHTVDLRARDRVYVNLDLGHHGLGSASCGPQPLPQHRLPVTPAQFTVTLRDLPG